MTLHSRIFALAVTAILSLSCDDSPTAPKDVLVAFETVVTSSGSGFAAPRQEVIRNGEEWARAWDLVHAGRSPVPTRPAVDFGREMVVLAAMGSSNNGCFRVEVEAIHLRDTTLEIEVAELEPSASCGCTQQITQPVHVVRLERLTVAESFDVRRRSFSC
jgi:hypothetical protein